MSKDRTYYRKQLETLEKVETLETRPSLLLHVCCGPCSSAVLKLLYPYFNITIYYANSNIYPQTEYLRRYSELLQFIPKFNRDYQTDIKVIEAPYLGKEYHKKLEPLKDEREGERRCHLCYGLRLKETFAYASTHNYEYVTTVLTLSRLKNSIIINEIAKAIATTYPTITYFYSDFKKNKGIDTSIELTKKYEMYRQEYCGCLYSYSKRKNR